MKNDKEVVVQGTNAVTLPVNQVEAVMNMLQTALEKGVDADSLEKLLNMQERILDRQSQQAYSTAMMTVQSRMPKVHKNRTNDQTRSGYADLEQVIKTITPIYTDEGFSLSFGTDDTDRPDCIRVTCEVMHKDGFTKSYHYDSPVDMHGIKGNQNKTAAHGAGSAIAYGRRYLSGMIFNLNTSDDDDANLAGGTIIEYIDDKQLGILRDLINATETNEAQFCRVCKVESLESLTLNKYGHAHKLLTDKKDGAK